MIDRQRDFGICLGASKFSLLVMQHEVHHTFSGEMLFSIYTLCSDFVSMLLVKNFTFYFTFYVDRDLTAFTDTQFHALPASALRLPAAEHLHASRRLTTDEAHHLPHAEAVAGGVVCHNGQQRGIHRPFFFGTAKHACAPRLTNSIEAVLRKQILDTDGIRLDQMQHSTPRCCARTPRTLCANRGQRLRQLSLGRVGGPNSEVVV